MQLPETDLTYGTVPGAPGSDAFFYSSVFGRKISQKSQSTRGPTQCKLGRAITWFAGVTICCLFFNNSSSPLCQFLCNKILFKKSATVKIMLIEQIIGLRGPGSPGRICTPITGCFHDKAVISNENIRLDCYLLLNYCKKQCTSPTWAKSLTKFNPKMQDFKRV